MLSSLESESPESQHTGDRVQVPAPLFAATILLLDYFGRGPYLELYSTVNLISTAGAVAPTFAGLTRDHTGSFTPFFAGLAVMVALVILAVMTMRAPHARPA